MCPEYHVNWKSTSVNFLIASFVFAFTAYQSVSLSDKMGAVVIRASIEGYECDILRWCGLELEVRMFHKKD